MSEFQYYEWQTVNRLLTEAEQASVARLSSHIEVSSGNAAVTYSWVDFKGDAQRLVKLGQFHRPETKIWSAPVYLSGTCLSHRERLGSAS